MRVLTDCLGQMVLRELRNAVEVRLAVAFFSPSEDVLSALAKIPRLTLIVFIGPFRAGPYSGRKWRFKNDAVIQVIDNDLPRDELAKALGKDSLLKTIHDLDRASFEQVATLLRKAGVQLQV